MLRQFSIFPTGLTYLKLMKKTTLFILLPALIIGCSSAKRSLLKNTETFLQSAFYDEQFTGFLLINSQNKDTLLDFNSSKYFTPASNTKIFTLFTALQLLPDHIPALKYIEQGDTLFVEGTGDPTFLHSYFEQNSTIDFLNQYDHIALHLDNYKEEKLGSGWAWDDYHYYYQPEIGALPMYGNVTTVNNSSPMQVTPSYFKDSVIAIRYHKNRDLEQNRFYFSLRRKDTVEIPFRTSALLTQTLLQKALKKEISLVQQLPQGDKKVFYSVATDTVLKRMMQVSDNFLAEQLLLLSSSTLSDTLSSTKVRDHILEQQLSNVTHPPRWVDGSGLSRYNLFTPGSMVTVLDKLYDQLPHERLFDFFPAGGINGTLEDWYAGDAEPYIYAKSGSLGNVYCLSGYLLTKSGKTLIFSFMNNHFRQPTAEVKKRMQQIFEEIRDSY